MHLDIATKKNETLGCNGKSLYPNLGKISLLLLKKVVLNIDTNFRLRQAIQNAKSANMPKDRVENAIKKASSKDAENFEEVTYEGYAAHGGYCSGYCNQ